MSCEAEIAQLQSERFVQQQVLQLQVAMGDSDAVTVIDRCDQLREEFPRAFFGETMLFL